MQKGTQYSNERYPPIELALSPLESSSISTLRISISTASTTQETPLVRCALSVTLIPRWCLLSFDRGAAPQSSGEPAAARLKDSRKP